MKLLQAKFKEPLLMGSAKVKLEDPGWWAYLNKYSYSIPLLMTSEGEVIREAHSFLLEKEIYSRSVTKTKTVETYSECLLDWFSYCIYSGTDWRQVSSRSLISYRNSMKQRDTGRSKALSAKTINLRMTVVLEFAKYYLRERSHTYPDNGTIALRLDKIRTTNFSVRDSGVYPIALSPNECQRLKARLKFPHRLIFVWGLSTGLRIGSILSIKLDDYMSIRDRGNGGFIEVQTKGGKKQKAFIPQHLINLTSQYIEIERRLQILRIHKRITKFDTDKLFVNSAGVAVNRQCYYSAYKRAGKFLEINSHPHQARTTFATFIEKSLRAYGASNGIDHIKIVQGLLGHSSAETTVGYLEGLKVNDADILALLESNSKLLGGRHG